jgi:hypothetical protein
VLHGLAVWEGPIDHTGHSFAYRRQLDSTVRSAITCTALTKLPRIGEGLVIPRDGRFIDLDGGEGELKVPAGISLPPQEP